MKYFVIASCFLCLIYFVYAYDPFEGFLQQGSPCFRTTDVPRSCNTTLAQSFMAKSEKLGNNEPTSSVYLFTPQSPDVAEPLHLCGGELPPNSRFDPEANTEVFIHGWLDGVCRTAWMREMKEQLFQRGRYNVILADWTWGNTFDYFLAGQNSKIIGEQIGFVINNIMRQTGVGPEKFHVIGHSFGAIASGFVGRSVPGLRRITAMDPAYAPFGDAPPDERVTYRDAQIVDVIHTNAFIDGCFAIGIGDPRPIGHADFYPNGGFIELSCYPYIFDSLLKGDILYGLSSLVPQLCSHLQAIQFYKVSINPGDCEFVGQASDSYTSYLRNKNEECGETAVMGMNYELHPAKNKTGINKYYLQTTLLCPYCEKSRCLKE